MRFERFSVYEQMGSVDFEINYSFEIFFKTLQHLYTLFKFDNKDFKTYLNFLSSCECMRCYLRLCFLSKIIEFNDFTKK